MRVPLHLAALSCRSATTGYNKTPVHMSLCEGSLNTSQAGQLVSSFATGSHAHIATVMDLQQKVVSFPGAAAITISVCTRLLQLLKSRRQALQGIHELCR